MPDGTFNATLVVLVEEAQPLELLTGMISSVGTDTITVTLPPFFLTERCARIDTAEISISMTSPNGVTFGPGTVADLMVGDTVDIYGVEAADGCMQARQVIAFTTGV